MGRYAHFGQEVLKRNGKLVGVNVGFGFFAEHTESYKGPEQRKTEKNIDKNKNHPFKGEIVENPQAIYLMELSDGRVWLTNNEIAYASVMRKNEEERSEYVDGFSNDDDKIRLEEKMAKRGDEIDSPEILALWSSGFLGGEGKFDLISTNKQTSELIKTLYAEIQKENVAISSNYSFMFKNKGLSFVLLDQLTKEDLMNKQLEDHRNELKRKPYKESFLARGEKSIAQLDEELTDLQTREQQAKELCEQYEEQLPKENKQEL